ARRDASPVPGTPPENETGSGSGAIAPDAAVGRKGASSASSAGEKRRSFIAWIKPPVETVAPAPAIGTGGVAGAFRMSSMLWIGVVPPIGSLEKGHPHPRAPLNLPST